MGTFPSTSGASSVRTLQRTTRPPQLGLDPRSLSPLPFSLCLGKEFQCLSVKSLRRVAMSYLRRLNYRNSNFEGNAFLRCSVALSFFLSRVHGSQPSFFLFEKRENTEERKPAWGQGTFLISGRLRTPVTCRHAAPYTSALSEREREERKGGGFLPAKSNFRIDQVLLCSSSTFPR